jgi:hypothetical protein
MHLSVSLSIRLCVSAQIETRLSFTEIVDELDNMIDKERGGTKKKKSKKQFSSLIDRHSTWF